MVSKNCRTTDQHGNIFTTQKATIATVWPSVQKLEWQENVLDMTFWNILHCMSWIWHSFLIEKTSSVHYNMA